ncbi:MAG: serine/threonine-protein phosphatase [Gammaproteobacteria bacterium]|nr:MAG: serine/threonine-protein phosphatase [Gammaproteobacteria bacterium]
MAVHRVECEHRTHVGLVRPHNEDYLACFPDLGVLVLGDGMGGHQAGEIAARIAVEAAAEALLSVQEEDAADELESLLEVGRAAEEANRAVFEAVARDPALKGMGTTLVTALFRGERVYFSYVGDSRLYRLRDGSLERLTRDHSLVQEVLDNGLFGSRAEVRAAGIGDNILTRCIGLDPDVEVDVGDVGLHEGDIFLACTDGLCGRVSDQTIRHVMTASPSLREMASDLVEVALRAGGRDNISVIVARPLL